MYLDTQKIYLDTQLDTKFKMYLRYRSRYTQCIYRYWPALYIYQRAFGIKLNIVRNPMYLKSTSYFQVMVFL